MARRRELKNIASGLYGSFISRNNDVAGYWGIGKLCLLAQRQDSSAVRIDLLAESIVPESSEFTKLVSGYGAILRKHLSNRDMPAEWLSSAVIKIDFKPELPSERYIPITTWGSLFKLTVEITDDRNKTYTISGYSYCGPHNPRKESKSAGIERF